MEYLQVVQLFAHAREFDGLACNGTHGKCTAAAGIAVQLRQDNAVQAGAFREAFGYIHSVDDEQRFVHLDVFLDALQFGHQVPVHMQAARRVEDDDVVAVVLCVGHGLFGNGFGLFPRKGEHRRTGLFAYDLQLIDCGGAVNIACGEQRAVALLDKVFGQLGGMRGFARALQAAHHDHRRRLGLDVDARGLAAAHQFRQLVVDDLDDLLRRGQALHDLLSHGALGDAGDKIFRNFIVDVRFQQGHAHLAHSVLNVLLGQLALAAQLFEYRSQLIA